MNENSSVERQPFAAFLYSVIGNFIMAGSFFQALVAPSAFTELIFRTGPLLFFIEIWSFYGSFFAMSLARTDRAASEKEQKNRYKSRFELLFIFFLLALALGYGFKNWFIPAFFFVSLGTKIFATKSHLEQFELNKNRIFFGFFGTMLVSFFIAERFYPFWQRVFPIPVELLQHKLSNASGSIIDHPQTLIVWGICYFALATLLEIYFFLKFYRKV